MGDLEAEEKEEVEVPAIITWKGAKFDTHNPASKQDGLYCDMTVLIDVVAAGCLDSAPELWKSRMIPERVNCLENTECIRCVGVCKGCPLVANATW